MTSYNIYLQQNMGTSMSSFRICSNCYGTQVYPYMGFMTGERYQCQECDEILVMPIEFEKIEDYVEFLKVQSPEKFAQIKGELKCVENEPVLPKNEETTEAFNASSNNQKLSHICIFENCQKGKKGGTDYCRKHWREGHDVEF